MAGDTSPQIPPGALALGLAGALPFWFAAVVFLFGGPISPAQALSVAVAYGAVILSFLGGIRWGAALGPIDEARRAREFGISVIPSLAGFAAFFVPPHLGLSILVSGFLLQALWDVTSTDQGLLPRWFGRLRIILTLAATVPLVVILAGLLISRA
jgi:hypothetical protein